MILNSTTPGRWSTQQVAEPPTLALFVTPGDESLVGTAGVLYRGGEQGVHVVSCSGFDVVSELE